MLLLLLKAVSMALISTWCHNCSRSGHLLWPKQQYDFCTAYCHWIWHVVKKRFAMDLLLLLIFGTVYCLMLMILSL